MSQSISDADIAGCPVISIQILESPSQLLGDDVDYLGLPVETLEPMGEGSRVLALGIVFYEQPN